MDVFLELPYHLLRSALTRLWDTPLLFDPRSGIAKRYQSISYYAETSDQTLPSPVLATSFRSAHRCSQEGSFITLLSSSDEPSKRGGSLRMKRAAALKIERAAPPIATGSPPVSLHSTYLPPWRSAALGSFVG